MLGTPPPDLTDAGRGSRSSRPRSSAASASSTWRRCTAAASPKSASAARSRGLPRDDYILCTKTGVTRPYAQPPMPAGATRRRQFDRWDYSAAATRASIETSLERLRTDRLDLVHLHDAEDHLDACLDAHAELARLRDDGHRRRDRHRLELSSAPVAHAARPRPLRRVPARRALHAARSSGAALIDGASARGDRRRRRRRIQLGRAGGVAAGRADVSAIARRHGDRRAHRAHRGDLRAARRADRRRSRCSSCWRIRRSHGAARPAQRGRARREPGRCGLRDSRRAVVRSGGRRRDRRRRHSARRAAIALTADAHRRPPALLEPAVRLRQPPDRRQRRSTGATSCRPTSCRTSTPAASTARSSCRRRRRSTRPTG